MKYQSFCMRALCLVLIIAAIAGYNSMQEKNEETQTSQEVEALTKRVETLEEQQKEMLAALKEAAENQENTSEKQKNTTSQKESDSEDPEETSENYYKDGTYTGEAQGFGGTIQIQLTLESDTMKEIQILSASGEDSAYLSQAQSVISKILSAQSTEVDTVSGATFSSTGIINAVVDALGKAEAQ